MPGTCLARDVIALVIPKAALVRESHSMPEFVDHCACIALFGSEDYHPALKLAFPRVSYQDRC